VADTKDKPKAGRPRKREEDKRRHPLRAYCNDRERALIVEAAEAYDMSVGEFIRACALATAHVVCPELSQLSELAVSMAANATPAEA